MCVIVTFAKLMLLCFQEHDLPQRGKKNAGSTVLSLSQNILFLSNVLKNAYVLCGKYWGVQHCCLYSVIEKSSSKGKADLQSAWGTAALFFSLFIASLCKKRSILSLLLFLSQRPFIKLVNPSGLKMAINVLLRNSLRGFCREWWLLLPSFRKVGQLDTKKSAR